MPDLAWLQSEFRAAFDGAAATRLAWAPGRVNLMGEHIDYCGLPVFPMALERGVHVLFRPANGGRIRAVSRNGFESREFMVERDPPPFAPGDWGNYLKAAAQGLAVEYGIARGMDALVWSDLPLAAGLSSSSALVVATALALLDANETPADRVVLMGLLARAERYSGTQGGGMDQAICLGAVKGTASRIDFHPLQLTPTPVPEDWRFIVAWGLERAEKSGAAQAAYNERTRDCAEALDSVARALGEPPGLSYPALSAGRPAAELLDVAGRVLDDRLQRRFRHVITEGSRVPAAQHAMTAGDLAAFGALLNASHASLRDDYEVSTPALDGLVAVARGAGAAGARLTGAGFGGCIVAVCQDAVVEHVLGGLRRDFYEPRGVAGDFDGLFIAKPSGGAWVRAASQ